MDLHVGIVMDVKNQQLFMKPICGYCNGCKKLATIMGLICRYCNGCKKPVTITRPICGYCIFEMTLWKL
jgi:predicted amidophosphoribosyltransferase